MRQQAESALTFRSQVDSSGDFVKDPGAASHSIMGSLAERMHEIVKAFDNFAHVSSPGELETSTRGAYVAFERGRDETQAAHDVLQMSQDNAQVCARLFANSESFYRARVLQQVGISQDQIKQDVLQPNHDLEIQLAQAFMLPNESRDIVVVAPQQLPNGHLSFLEPEITRLLGGLDIAVVRVVPITSRMTQVEVTTKRVGEAPQTYTLRVGDETIETPMPPNVPAAVAVPEAGNLPSESESTNSVSVTNRVIEAGVPSTYAQQSEQALERMPSLVFLPDEMKAAITEALEVIQTTKILSADRKDEIKADIQFKPETIETITTISQFVEDMRNQQKLPPEIQELVDAILNGRVLASFLGKAGNYQSQVERGLLLLTVAQHLLKTLPKEEAARLEILLVRDTKRKPQQVIVEARRDVDYDWGTLQAIADTEKSESKQIDTSKIPPRRIPLLSGEGAVWLIADSQPDTAAYASNISSALREQKVLHLHESIVKVTRDRKFVMTDTGRTIRIKSLI